MNDERDSPYSPPQPKASTTAVERFRRLLREMTALERVVYTTAAVGSFVFGPIVPSLYGHALELDVLDRFPIATRIGGRLGDMIPFDNPFFVAVVAALAAGAGGLQAAISVVLVALLPSIGVRVFRKSLELVQIKSIELVQLFKSLCLVLLVNVKLGTLSGPSLACGCVAGMVLGWVGVCATPPGFYAFNAFLASQWFWGSVAGIAAIVYTPAYKHALPRLIAQLRRTRRLLAL